MATFMKGDVVVVPSLCHSRFQICPTRNDDLRWYWQICQTMMLFSVKLQVSFQKTHHLFS